MAAFFFRGHSQSIIPLPQEQLYPKFCTFFLLPPRPPHFTCSSHLTLDEVLGPSLWMSPLPPPCHHIYCPTLDIMSSNQTALVGIQRQILYLLLHSTSQFLNLKCPWWWLKYKRILAMPRRRCWWIPSVSRALPVSNFDYLHCDWSTVSLSGTEST